MRSRGFLITESLYHSQFSLTNSSLRPVVVEHGAMVSWRRAVVMGHMEAAVQKLVCIGIFFFLVVQRY